MSISRFVALLMLLSTSLIGQQDYGMMPPVNINSGVQTRSSICVPGPKTDRMWDRSKSFETQVNEAIDGENIAFRKSYPDYNHPSYDSNDPDDISNKILTELRRVYRGDGISELEIEYDLSVNELAIDHSCAMDLDNTFCHTCPSDGSYQSRVDNRIGRRCWTSIGENIAWTSLPDLEEAILRIIYLMMYGDVACCNNGHRDNFLKCTYNENTKLGFGVVRGDIQSTNGNFIDSWIMTWDYVTYGAYPNCGDCNCNVSIGTPLCDATSGVVLPVELVSFDQQDHDCNRVALNWQTASEFNHDYFELERSTDLNLWSSVSTVNGTGNSNQVNSYSVTDDISQLQTDIIYYRLAQVDYSGQRTDSEVISVQLDCDNLLVSISPNPASSTFTLHSNKTISSIAVTDYTGQKVHFDSNSSSNTIDGTKWPSGIYFVSIETSEGWVEVVKLIKAK